MNNQFKLILGTCGTGKSVLLRKIISNYLDEGDDNNYLFVDPKKIEFHGVVNKNRIKRIASFMDLETILSTRDCKRKTIIFIEEINDFNKIQKEYINNLSKEDDLDVYATSQNESLNKSISSFEVIRTNIDENGYFYTTNKCEEKKYFQFISFKEMIDMINEFSK